MYEQKIIICGEAAFRAKRVKIPDSIDFRKTLLDHRSSTINIFPVRAKRSDPAATSGDAVFIKSVISGGEKCPCYPLFRDQKTNSHNKVYI